VLLAEVGKSDDASMTATRLLHAVAQPHLIDGHDLRVTASIGVSVYPEDGTDARTLMSNADTAMYQAKADGRHGIRFFRPAMNARAVERQSIETSLRCALERREFALHYQPKINLTTGEIIGAEGLLRWTHPERGPIPPAQFIHIAEDCGLIVPIGRWVLREACVQAAAWVAAGLRPITMSVNVSAMEFRDKSFLSGVLRVLEETEMDARSLELELTESVLMKDVASTATILQTLRESGVQVAVDDFGTGYSSLSYLHKFPVDALKIDQSFVRQIAGAGEDATMVTAVINMARSLSLRVVAEGVENLAESDFLRSHHCDEAQGFHFGRPVPAATFALMLEDGFHIPWRSETPELSYVRS
jgi:EAL domain-containing protein (putative c-di-GMP-specific phosphodiesterase class I)